MRMLRALGIAGLIIAMAVGPARAEDPYPTRPISMVVAFPPGGLADNTARPVATALERILKQPVAIINKAGAAGAGGNQTGGPSKPPRHTPPPSPPRNSPPPGGGQPLRRAAHNTPRPVTAL